MVAGELNNGKRTFWLGGLAMCVCVMLPVQAVADESGPALEDPLPLQRLVIPLSRLPAELERVRQGVLVKLPRAEFEKLVQRAARAADLAKDVPHLGKVRYTAELVGDSLTRGSGQWSVHATPKRPAGLPLGTFNL